MCFTKGQIQANLKFFLKCAAKQLTLKGRRTLFDLSPKREGDSKWRFSIPESSPVEFISGQPDVADELHPEFFGHIIGPGDGLAFSEYRICFRVWSSKKNYNFWAPTDSELAKKTFIDNGTRRLILRLRFDLHERKEGKIKSYHPWFHMHIGGKSRIKHLDPRKVPPEGHYRYPPTIDPPRISTFPMSFILVGRFILANYHPRDYRRMCSDNSEWNSLMAREERVMWENFIIDSKSYISADLVKESFFDRTSMESKFGRK
ncbi:MAG: hypothetical protein ACFFER_10465 [Candidatus Thorarchaeota archaeon]